MYLRHTYVGEKWLKLNNDKTELTVWGTKQQLSKVDDVSIKIGNDTIPAVSSAQNLGVHFDR